MKDLRNYLLFVFAIAGFAIQAPAQEDTNAVSSLDKAKELSAATGRPIFAVAGKST